METNEAATVRLVDHALTAEEVNSIQILNRSGKNCFQDIFIFLTWSKTDTVVTQRIGKQKKIMLRKAPEPSMHHQYSGKCSQSGATLVEDIDNQAGSAVLCLRKHVSQINYIHFYK